MPSTSHAWPMPSVCAVKAVAAALGRKRALLGRPVTGTGCPAQHTFRAASRYQSNLRRQDNFIVALFVRDFNKVGPVITRCRACAARVSAASSTPANHLLQRATRSQPHGLAIRRHLCSVKGLNHAHGTRLVPSQQEPPVAPTLQI